MNSGMKEYSFLWFIENFSYSENSYGAKLVSPEFTPEGMGGTSWVLRLYPIRRRYDINSLYLKRCAHDAGPESFSLKLEISVITANGFTLYSKECEHAFRKGDQRGFQPLLGMNVLYVRRNTECFPQDTLGVHCRMWQGEGSVLNVVHWSARTRMRFEKISFLHRVENFSALELQEEKILQIPCHSETGGVISSIISIINFPTDDDNPIDNETVEVNIVHSGSNYIMRRIALSLLDVSGNIKECGEVDYRLLDVEEQIYELHFRLTRQFIQNNRKEYLPNDELSLLCECTFSTGVESKIEEILHEIPIAAYNHRYHNALGENDNKIAERLTALPNASEHMKMNLYMCPSVQDDFKALYNDELLTDMVFKTATKSFPAHKIVLCARSPVFRAMLTNDMKEKITDCIKVEDLENGTVQQLLLFLYSDNLEKLQWESALKLYYAGDKYAVEKLKVLCSSFLVENLSTSTASELLLLADTHSDADFKKCVEDFILEHEEEVFGSDEWDKFSERNPQLFMKTMKLKYKRKKKVN